MKTLKKFVSPILMASFLPLAAGLAQADLLDEIKERGEIVIATEARYAPFEMIEDLSLIHI